MSGLKKLHSTIAGVPSPGRYGLDADSENSIALGWKSPTSSSIAFIAFIAFIAVISTPQAPVNLKGCHMLCQAVLTLINPAMQQHAFNMHVACLPRWPRGHMCEQIAVFDLDDSSPIHQINTPVLMPNRARHTLSRLCS